MRRLSLLATFALVALMAGAQTYKLTVTKNNGQTVVIPTNDISKIEFVEQQTGDAKGDLLDIEFLPDGTAVDRSPMQHEVITNAGSSLMTYYSNLHKRYVANFRNTMGESTNHSYYRVNYTKGGDFINRIADGCTMETIIKLNEADAPGKEVKWFSSMQAGGVGFILPMHQAAKPGTRCLTFLPNISTTGSSNWCWTYSDVEPVPGTYYHVVGVWNKEEGRSYIYVNGRLSGTAAAPGNYVPVANGAESFVLGGDSEPNQTTAASAFNGELVTVRIYDKPMTADEVAELWADEAFDQEENPINITDLKYLSECEVSPGCKYSFYGKGFADGDVVELQSEGATIKPATTIDGERVTLTIPADFKTGSYSLILKRGEAQAPLFIAKLNAVASSPAIPQAVKVIAHRGAHTDGASENSIAALSKAMDANYYGIELDVWITADDQLVVHHDGVVNGTYFQNVNYSAIKNIKLSNGESLPTFDSFIETFKSKMAASSSKLIIEIKSHSNLNRTYAAVDKVMDIVKAEGLTDRVEYIAFSYDACKRIVSKDPDAMVGYLYGNLAPATVLNDGIRSIDYSSPVLNSNLQWIKEGRDLGMTVNVWTVNGASDMLRFMGLGVHYITTDAPAMLDELTKLTFVEE